MKQSSRAAILLLSLLVTGIPAKSQVTIVKDVVACGGGQTDGASWTIGHTVGQGTIGLVTTTDHRHGIGFWHLPWVYVTGAGEADETPLAYRLYQNVPNPFNPRTYIRLDMPRPSRVTVRIYDVTGRLVMTAHDGALGAGTHEIPVRASDLATGVYFYRVIAGGFAETRKMVVLR
ncbi:MAG: T9SS type A sorting domain-containing protein [Candidatus Krumholzibacteriota bacterium]|nr:T9SS type A sorting domain-containing protein [Candidatus Krumholzibacteriota bacterium]